MRRWLLVAALLVACKDKEPDGPKITITKGSVTYVSDVCKKAIDAAPNAPLDARPKLLIDSCQVCDDWNTILTWNLEGTKPERLQTALEGCDTFCNGDAKMKFIAGFDRAKGTANDTPWRRLADACGERVDASTDHRFMSAPYFALDRIARAVTKAPHGESMAAKLAAIELPLPALTVAGTGLVLPEVDKTDSPMIHARSLTIVGDEIYLGTTPRAKLGASGVIVDFGEVPYPGKPVKLADLGAALAKDVNDDLTKTVTILAPRAMPAQKLVPIVAAAMGGITPVYLGAAAEESPAGWQLPAAVPYQLQIGKDGIKVTSEMTVQNLASEIMAKRSGTLQGP